jgi:hypothetical protein
MALCALFGVAFIVGLFVLCPLQSNFEESTAGVQCNQFSGYIISGTLNLVLDIVIVVLPMPLVWQLQMETKRKAAITFIFGIGIVCVLLSSPYR